MLEDRWCERRGVGSVAEVLGVDVGEHEFHAVFDEGGVGVGCAGGFEGKTDVFPASWGAGPVDEFEGRGLLTLWGLGGGHFGRLAGLQTDW